MTKKLVSTDRLMVPIAHFSLGQRVDNVIHLGATAGTDPNRRLAGSAPGVTDIGAQTDLMYRNMAIALELLGGSMNDVVRVKGYITDWRDFKTYNEVHAQHFTAPLPSRATVGTWGFPLPFAIIEVEFTAIVGAAKRYPVTDALPQASGPYPQAGVTCGDHHFGVVVGEDRSGRVVEGIPAQTEHALANLEATLKASAMSLMDVVMLTVTLADIRDYHAFEEVFRSVFRPPYPARTISGAPLADPDMLVEIETISVAGGGRPVIGYGALPQAGAASPAMLAGEHLYVSAQPGVAADGSMPRGAEAQTRAAWQRVEAILAEVGMNVTDVVRTNNWLTDWRSYAGFNTGFGAFVVPPFPPRATVIGALTDPHSCVQVEAVGHRLGRDATVIDVNHGKNA